MTATGLERSPTDQFGRSDPTTEQGRESIAAFDIILQHETRTKAYLGLDSEAPYRASPADIAEYRAEQERSRATSFCTTRDVRDVTRFVMTTVTQMEAEMATQRVLDIGCGEGRFGERMARNAKSKVTFLDEDAAVLERISPKAGPRVIARAQDLPFEAETFDRTIMAFSGLMWAVTPSESVAALNEALRVTRVGGTSLFIPFFTQLMYRRIDAEYNEQAQKVWALQDYALLHAVRSYISAGFCSVTWSGFVGTNSYTKIDFYSAVVDKEASIPQSVLDEELNYAKSLELT